MVPCKKNRGFKVFWSISAWGSNLAPHFNHMFDSKLKDIRNYIWVEEICHGCAEIDWDTFNKISKSRTILDIFSGKLTTKWRNNSLFWQLHRKKLFWAGLVSKQRSFRTTNFCFCNVMEVSLKILTPCCQTCKKEDLLWETVSHRKPLQFTANSQPTPLQ